MQTTFDITDLKTIVKEAVKEALREEKLDIFINNLPYVSDEEMKDIEVMYGKSQRREAAYTEEIGL